MDLPNLVVPGQFFDGESAGSKRVQATADPVAQTFTIRAEDGAVLAQWPLEKVRRVKDHGHADGAVLYEDGGTEARLNAQYSADGEALTAYVPKLNHIEVRKGAVSKVLIWGAGSVAALALMYFVILPSLADNLARYIPPAREEAIGRSVVSQIERVMGVRGASAYCSSTQGDAALSKMTDRLTADLDLPYPLKVQVMNHRMVNAFAAPGGYVVIMRGLLDAADTPGEVAGVLAHEIGHVHARDPLRITLRAAGSAGIVSMVLGDVFGGALIAVVSEQLLQASYTRTAEAQADEFAHQMLSNAQLSSEGLASFFDKLKRKHGDMDGALEYLSSHPNLSGRAEAARGADAFAGREVMPVLSDSEWDALQNICK